ncbi:hypothetical protein JCM10908_006833 [Rhodotorula pacifica]|uniref:uncharacterized protein n=1 Tax=Rhodotorula pacifica TaxID=1495444 RepID=UPI0031748ABF
MTSQPRGSPFPPDFEPVCIVSSPATMTPAPLRRSSSPLPLHRPAQPERHHRLDDKTRLERGTVGAIGPKAGARLLASQSAQRAMRKADELEQFGDADERECGLDIREHLAVRTDGGLSTVTATSTKLGPGLTHAPLDRKAAPSSASSSGSAGQRSIPRVPVPRLANIDIEIHSPRPLPLQGRRMSIHDLTRQASEEEKLESPDDTERKKESWGRASGAGLGSPFAEAAAAAANGTDGSAATGVLPTVVSIEPPRKLPHRRPPIAGLNRAVTSPDDLDASSTRVVSHGSNRHRKVSGGSTASVSKDAVLNQLSDAIRRERKKAEAYERERKQGQSELDEIGRNLQVLKEKYSTILQQQEDTIETLRSEIEEVDAELEWANDLDEETAEKYLELISSSTPLDSLKIRRHVVSGFDPSALGTGAANPPQSTETAVSPTPATMETVKRAVFLFRRGLSLKRRVDTHVAAYDTVANVSLPKPTIDREPRRAELTSSGGPSSSDLSLTAAGNPLPRRMRKLSRSRTLPAPPQQLPPGAQAGEVPSILHAPTTAKAKPAKPSPPPPAPIFRSLSSAEPSPLDAKPHPPTTAPPARPSMSPSRPKARRPPPVAGITRSRQEELPVPASAGAAPVSTAEGEPIRQRKRSNSFKQGVQSTMRALFPPHAAKVSKEEERARNVREWMEGGAAPTQA